MRDQQSYGVSPTLGGVLCVTSWSASPRGFEGEERFSHGLSKDVLEDKGKGGILAGLFLVHFLIVWQAMKATRLGCFLLYKDRGNSTAQSTPSNHCKYSTVWVSGSCLEPSESSTHTPQQKYKPQWYTLFFQKHYVKFNENGTQPEVGF